MKTDKKNNERDALGRFMHLFVPAMLFAVSACGHNASPVKTPAPSDHPAGETGKPDLRVLFLGNSLTAVNDLPRLVQAMAASAGIRLDVAAISPGGFALEDHWNDGQAQQALAGKHWDWVVLQQGPSTRPESQTNLKEWAVRWADEARRHGAKTALYMVWPFRAQKDGFRLVSHSYRSAARASKARILPAGEAWQEALRQDPNLPLYQDDGLHPTAAGSYLAALVITERLMGVKPRSVPTQLKLPSGAEFVVPREQAKKLRRAAEMVRHSL
jgi:hypothetical protein